MPAALNPDTFACVARAVVRTTEAHGQYALTGHGMPNAPVGVSLTVEVGEVDLCLSHRVTEPLTVGTLTDELGDVDALTDWLVTVWGDDDVDEPYAVDGDGDGDATLDVIGTYIVDAPAVPHPLKSTKVRSRIADALTLAGWRSVSPSTGLPLKSHRHYAARAADGADVVYYVVTR